MPESLENRLYEKLTKENLWLYILALLYEKEKYGYELRGEIKKRFGFWSGNVTAYRVLYSLHSRGLVEQDDREVKGRIRRYYKITGKGKASYLQGKKKLKDVLSSLP